MATFTRRSLWTMIVVGIVSGAVGSSRGQDEAIYRERRFDPFITPREHVAVPIAPVIDEFAGSPVLGGIGYGYSPFLNGNFAGLGYGWGYPGWGYGWGYSGLGYSGLGYGGLGYAGFGSPYWPYSGYAAPYGYGWRFGWTYPFGYRWGGYPFGYGYPYGYGHPSANGCLGSGCFAPPIQSNEPSPAPPPPLPGQSSSGNASGASIARFYW